MIETIKIIDKAIKHLEKKKKELLLKIKCKHGEYTNELFNTHGCKTCGSPKLVICSHKKIFAKKRNGKICNKQGCEYFEVMGVG